MDYPWKIDVTLQILYTFCILIYSTVISEMKKNGFKEHLTGPTIFLIHWSHFHNPQTAFSLANLSLTLQLTFFRTSQTELL